jgi:membrane protein involved in colicin uptake
VPKTATEYYDDIERFEHNGASYVGKKATIQKMKLAISEAEKAAKDSKKKAEKDAEAEEAKKKAKAEKDAKKKKPAADASPKGKADDLDFDIDEEGDLTELQQALIDCLMPAVKK